MICVLIGIVPPTQSALNHLQKYVTEIDGKKVVWHESALAKDADDNDRPTLLMSAVGEFSPDGLINVVNLELIKFAGKSSEFDEKKSEDECPPRCEIWASAPSPLPLLQEGQSFQILNNKDGDWLAKAAMTMKQWGVLSQSSVLNADQISDLRSLVDNAIEETDEMLAKFRPDVNVGQDVFAFQEIASRSKERFDLRLLNSDAGDFVERHIMNHPQVASLLEEMLGKPEELDFDVSCVYSRPGADYQGWHADGQHVNGANDAGWGKDGWDTDLAQAYAICLFIPLIPLNDKVGYTQFWPGTHRYRDLVGFGKVAEIAGATYDGICSAGDAIWYDYRCLHRGMPNQSCDTLRPVVQIIFKKKWYVEKRNYGSESIASNCCLG